MEYIDDYVEAIVVFDKAWEDFNQWMMQSPLNYKTYADFYKKTVSPSYTFRRRLTVTTDENTIHRRTKRFNRYTKEIRDYMQK